MATKGKMMNFKAEPEYTEKIRRLSKKWGLDVSKTIRKALDEAVAKYIIPGYRGDIMVISVKDFDSMLRGYQASIDHLEVENKALNHVLGIVAADPEVKWTIQLSVTWLNMPLIPDGA